MYPRGEEKLGDEEGKGRCLSVSSKAKKGLQNEMAFFVSPHPSPNPPIHSKRLDIVKRSCISQLRDRCPRSTTLERDDAVAQVSRNIERMPDLEVGCPESPLFAPIVQNRDFECPVFAQIFDHKD